MTLQASNNLNQFKSNTWHTENKQTILKSSSKKKKNSHNSEMFQSVLTRLNECLQHLMREAA